MSRRCLFLFFKLTRSSEKLYRFVRIKLKILTKICIVMLEMMHRILLKVNTVIVSIQNVYEYI